MAEPKTPVFAEFQVTRTISQYEMASLLCCAFEGGIGYWATIVGYRQPAKLDVTFDKLSAQQYSKTERENLRVYKYIDYPLNEGGAVILRDAEDPEGEELTLDMSALRRGLQVMCDKYPGHFAHVGTGGEDAVTGDVFVQCCVLGEIVYV
jgi:hypothetical protein